MVAPPMVRLLAASAPVGDDDEDEEDADVDDEGCVRVVGAGMTCEDQAGRARIARVAIRGHVSKAMDSPHQPS